MTPLLILYLLFMDFVFIIQTVIFKNIVLIAKQTCFRGRFSKHAEKCNILGEFEARIFKGVFGMEKHEVVGFKRLRTITQMVFETIP